MRSGSNRQVAFTSEKLVERPRFNPVIKRSQEWRDPCRLLDLSLRGDNSMMVVISILEITSSMQLISVISRHFELFFKSRP